MRFLFLLRAENESRKNVGACLETVLGSNKHLSEKRDQHGDPRSSVAHLPRVKHTAMSDESTSISNNHVYNFHINFQQDILPNMRKTCE